MASTHGLWRCRTCLPLTVTMEYTRMRLRRKIPWNPWCGCCDYIRTTCRYLSAFHGCSCLHWMTWFLNGFRTFDSNWVSVFFCDPLKHQFFHQFIIAEHSVLTIVQNAFDLSTDFGQTSLTRSDTNILEKRIHFDH